MLKLEDFKAAKKRVDEVILPTHLILCKKKQIIIFICFLSNYC